MQNQIEAIVNKHKNLHATDLITLHSFLQIIPISSLNECNKLIFWNFNSGLTLLIYTSEKSPCYSPLESQQNRVHGCSTQENQ